MTDREPKLDRAVDTILPDALDLSHRVHANPEVVFQERFAAGWTAAPPGTPGHSRQFAAHAGGADGDRMLPIAIRVLAATALETVRDAALVGRAWQELRAAGGGRGGEPAG